MNKKALHLVALKMTLGIIIIAFVSKLSTTVTLHFVSGECLNEKGFFYTFLDTCLPYDSIIHYIMHSVTGLIVLIVIFTIIVGISLGAMSLCESMYKDAKEKMK